MNVALYKNVFEQQPAGTIEVYAKLSKTCQVSSAHLDGQQQAHLDWHTLSNIETALFSRS